MEIAYDRSYTSVSNNSGLKNFITLLLLITMIVVGGTNVSHAVQKHKEEAIATRNCIDNHGADITYDRDDDRKIQLCFIGLKPDGTFAKLGIRVMEKINGAWEELTAFTNNNITTVEQAIGFAEYDAGKYGFISYVKECWKIFLHGFIQ